MKYIFMIFIFLSSCAVIPQSELKYSKTPKSRYAINNVVKDKECNKE